MLKELIYILIGSITGISMGIIGIGAGLISMPLLIYSGLSIKQSVGTAMVMQLLPQSIPGVINYWKDILWKPSILVILGSILGIWFGSYLVKNNFIKERILYRAITIFLLVSSIYFYYEHWN
jgi:hypothetical protein